MRAGNAKRFDMAKRLKAGVVRGNFSSKCNTESEFGGYNESSIGREGGVPRSKTHQVVGNGVEAFAPQKPTWRL